MAPHILRGIDEARDRLSDFLKGNPPPTKGERRQVAIEKARLDNDWQKVFLEMMAVDSGSSFKPPTDTDVLHAKTIANELDEMIGNNLTIANILQGATQVMNIWNQTGVGRTS